MSWSYFPKESNLYYEESVQLYLSRSINLKDSEYSKDSKDEFFYIEETIRAHSSGFEQSRRKFFKTFDLLLEYLQDHVPEITKEEWSEDNTFFTDETMETRALRPSDDFIKSILLNPKRLYEFVKSSGGKIYGPYNKFCCLVPFEIHVYCETF